MTGSIELWIKFRKFLNSLRRASGKKSSKNRTNEWIIGWLYEAELEGRVVYQKTLEADFGITRSTASKTLSSLEESGLVERVGVSHDARLKKLLLTKKSRELAQNARKHAALLSEKMVSGFSREEIDTLTGLLGRVQENLEKYMREGAKRS